MNFSFSCIIPTYNEGDWLVKTVDSLREAADGYELEIIVIDDWGDDGSVENVRDKSRVIKSPNKNSGVIINRNLGARESKNDILVFVDSHVLVEKSFFDELSASFNELGTNIMLGCNILDTKYLDKPQHHGCKYSYTVQNIELSAYWFNYPAAETPKHKKAPCLATGCIAIPEEHFDAVGGFNSSMRFWGEGLRIKPQELPHGFRKLCEPRY